MDLLLKNNQKSVASVLRGRKKMKIQFKMCALLHIVQNCPLGLIGVCAGLILGPRPNV